MEKVKLCCANSSKEVRCEQRATPGHIYCKNCRIALGGYDRHTPLRAQSHTRSKQQEI